MRDCCIWRPDGKVYGAIIRKFTGAGTKLTIRYVDDGIVCNLADGGVLFGLGGVNWWRWV